MIIHKYVFAYDLRSAGIHSAFIMYNYSINQRKIKYYFAVHHKKNKAKCLETVRRGAFLFDYQRKLRSRNSAGDSPTLLRLLSSRLSLGVSLLIFLSGSLEADKADYSHLGTVAATGSELVNAGVTAVAISIRGCYLIERLLWLYRKEQHGGLPVCSSCRV